MQRVTRGVSNSDSWMVGCTCTGTRSYSTSGPRGRERARTRSQQSRRLNTYTYACVCARVCQCAYVNPPQWDPPQWPLSVALVERNEKRGPPLRRFLLACVCACVRARAFVPPPWSPIHTFLCFLQFGHFHICRHFGIVPLCGVGAEHNKTFIYYRGYIRLSISHSFYPTLISVLLTVHLINTVRFFYLILLLIPCRSFFLKNISVSVSTDKVK